MALRLRRDVQKASYYVWFLGAEEAKGLRGSRIINSVLPYLIDRSRGQEPLKVTLQVSHKGIKILQGSSKHFIPHSAITSSVQTDDIVACVLLLYNPATKCPLHVHAYRCDSESTAEALQQQLQILINRPENQRRFEELENRLGILPAMPTTSGNKSSTATSAHIKSEHSQKQHLPYHQQKQPQPQQQRRLETSPKRFSSSLGSDTGNSTRESECSEEHSGSPDSRSPPMPKPLQQNSELFDSLAAELRAKLNGNGPPILLPPRDYDTVHRSKGNLAAIELRRCRNKLIVGSTTSPTGTMQQNMTPAAPTTGVGGGVAVKQVSSRGSSGIGSDLAPSPERQELNSSSDDERWSNEADNSVIALKPSQIPIERSAMPIVAHHPLLNRKSAMHPPEDSYLRDLPAKPYTPHATTNGRPQIGNNAVHSSRDKPPNTASTSGGNQRSKTPTTTASWTREDEIKPIIMRPADYDAKFNRVLQAEQKQEYHRSSTGREQRPKLQDTDKYNEINRLLNKKHTRDGESPERQRYGNKADELDDFDDSDPLSDHLPLHATSSAGYRKENLTDKQKFLEYNTQKQSKQAAEEPQRYGGRHRYVDPADLPFEQPNHKKYAAVHRGVAASPERSDLGHRTAERQRERPRVLADDAPPRERERERDRERDRARERYSRSSERNPYREPESLPYIQSMEKMMKSAALCYKSYEGAVEPPSAGVTKLEPGQPIATHAKVIQRTKSNPKHEDNRQDYNYTRSTGSGSGRPDYAPSAGSGSNISPKDRFKDAKNKFHAMERSGSRYDLTDEKDGISDYKTRRHESAADKSGGGLRVYDDWSDEERLDDSPPSPVTKTRSRSRDRWEQAAAPVRERDIQPPRELVRDREPRDRRDYSHDVRARELPGMRSEPRDIRESRDSRVPREPYTREHRYDQREENRRDMPPSREREASRTELAREHQRVERTRDHSRDYKREHAVRRDYTPDKRGEHRSNDYVDHRSMEKQRVPHSTEKYPPPNNGAPISNAKVLSGIPKGYRHSYAEPVFVRSGGRVGLAAVNPF